MVFAEVLMPPTGLTLAQLRRVVQNSWEELVGWLLAKPRILELPHPEQQILFELGCRMRGTLRSLVGDVSWDRMVFDASSSTLGAHANADAFGRRPPIYIDTRHLFGVGASERRTTAKPNLAVSVCVLRSCRAALEVDDDGRPKNQTFLPTSVRTQGWLLEEHVRQLEELELEPCDGFLFVVYSNSARRRTAVDTREVASWASWQTPSDTLWWASRHFRAKARH
jgi:hypothetical protein